jgi:hypothetical protein
MSHTAEDRARHLKQSERKECSEMKQARPSKLRGAYDGYQDIQGQGGGSNDIGGESGKSQNGNVASRAALPDGSVRRRHEGQRHHDENMFDCTVH